MKEYQKALDRQKSNVKKIRDKEFVEYRDDFQTLQEAVDKANKYDDKETPKKPIIERFRESEHYICPNCKKHRFGILGYGEYKNEFRKNSNFTPYCPNCGQRLDWSDTNE